MTPEQITANAKAVRNAGFPDSSNRWIGMTPEKWEAHSAAIASIAAQQRGEFNLNTAAIGTKEAALRTQKAEAMNGSAPAALPETKPAAPAQPAASAATKESAVKTTITATKTAMPKTSAKVQKPSPENRRAPEQAKKASANARTPVKPDLKTTGTHEKPKSKSAMVDQMLRKAAGATREELSKATGWPQVNLKVAAARADMKLIEKEDRFRIVAASEVAATKDAGWKPWKF